jgi:hypothetical protein
MSVNNLQITRILNRRLAAQQQVQPNPVLNSGRKVQNEEFQQLKKHLSEAKMEGH